jgi:transcription initiation factor TFIIA large subunit
MLVARCLNKWHEGTENRSKGTDNRKKGTGVVFKGSNEQVTRVRNKWKVLLKDGVMSIHGRDYIFKKASCEFEW